MISISIKTPNDLLELRKDFATGKDLDAIANIVLEDVKDRTPENSGRLKRDTIMKRNGENERIITVKTERSKKIQGYMHLGTDDHRVEPVKKLALHWTKGEVGYFSKGHIVSGIKKFIGYFSPSPNALSKINTYINKMKISG